MLGRRGPRGRDGGATFGRREDEEAFDWRVGIESGAEEETVEPGVVGVLMKTGTKGAAPRSASIDALTRE